MRRVCKSPNVPAERRQHVDFGGPELIALESSVGTRREPGQRRRLDFLDFRSQQEASSTDELEMLRKDLNQSNRKVEVDEHAGVVEGLGVEAQMLSNVHEPVKQIIAHLPVDVALRIQVIAFDLCR